jgi:hypothetical protein
MMNALPYLATMAMVCAAIVALLLARRRADHRPFAVFLCVVTVANLLRVARGLIAPIRPLDAPPYEGWARVVFHIDQGLFLSWAAGLAVLVVVLFISSPRWPAILPGVAWAGTVGYLATHYPAVRGEALRDVYLAAELGALVVATGSIITWTWRRASPTSAHACALFVVLFQAVVLMGGALRYGIFQYWYLDQM